MVVLARAPDVMDRLRVAEFVRAVEHLREGLSRRPFWNGFERPTKREHVIGEVRV